MSQTIFTDFFCNVKLHVASGLFICVKCNDATARDKPGIISHMVKTHGENQEALDRLPVTLVNPSIQIPALSPTKGYKCSNCGIVSKNKKISSFKQWHYEKSPQCKDTMPLEIKIQIRLDQVFEYKDEAPPTESFLQRISREYYAKQSAILSSDDDVYSSNPLQVYFGVFTVFGNDISPQSVIDYKGRWDANTTALVNQGFRNFFEQKGKTLSQCDVIRSIMGVGMQMYQFKRSSNSYDSLGKLWAKILSISMYSQNNYFKVPVSVREKAIHYFDCRSEENLISFLK